MLQALTWIYPQTLCHVFAVHYTRYHIVAPEAGNDSVTDHVGLSAGCAGRRMTYWARSVTSRVKWPV